MSKDILLKNVRLPMSSQWKDTPVEILISGEMIQSVQPQVVVGQERIKEIEILDGKGRAVLPGLMDAHAHLVMTGLRTMGVDLSPARTIPEILELLRQQAQQSSSSIIIGHTFDPSALKEHRYLTLEDLDTIEDVVKGRVVYVPRRDYHSCVVNRAGLKKIPFPRDVQGIVMAEDGKTPTGILKHGAAGAASYYLFSQGSLSEKQEALRKVCRDAVALGITTIHVLEEPNSMEVLLSIREELPLDTLPYFSTLDVSIPIQKGFRQLGGCEHIATDGSFSSHTAALDEPFYDDPNERGTLYFQDEELFDVVERAHNEGLQICIHALADRAIDQVIRAYERALKMNPREDHRHRIEHCELVREDHYRRIVDNGIYLSMQPTFEYLWGGPDGMYAQYLGPERRLKTNPFRTWWDLGAVVAGGSDSHVTPLDSLLGIHSMVNNPNEAQRLTVHEAIVAFTENVAKIGFEEKIKGWVVPGFRADLIMLQDNPFEVSPETIKDLKVACTIYRGKKVYTAEEEIVTRG